MKLTFLDNKGNFTVEQPCSTSYLYLPLTNADGIMDSITPDGHGDSKLNQNEFLLEPVSCDDLHTSTSSRNVWCRIRDKGVWSAMGVSAMAMASRGTKEEDVCTLRAGKLWQEVTRRSAVYELEAKIRNFCPSAGKKTEIMQIWLRNTGKRETAVTLITAIPIYGRSADNQRDHRHVTSLLNRIFVTEDGVQVTPTLSFDERGHQKNERTYGVYGRREDGQKPCACCPVMEDFAGEGGSLLWPEAVCGKTEEVWKTEGVQVNGYEAMGALRFPEMILKPGECREYTILLSYDGEGMVYLEAARAEKAFEETKHYWDRQSAIHCTTGNSVFDAWMEWVGIQPVLRRIYGCSFLPHHDYGRGGRGWRDLWQDSLALLLGNPASVRDNLVSYFAGVRMDGSNATIIGSRPGEFKADRNAIVRVWMDHGFWPFLTMNLYMEQTGDYAVLLEEVGYFKDSSSHRGEAQDKANQADTMLRTNSGEAYKGTVLEHLLVENLTAFYDVGIHNHMRLRGADWNDALDMAVENGESVAFTAAYSGNLKQLAHVLERMRNKMRIESILIAEELLLLLGHPGSIYECPEKKTAILREYCDRCMHRISGERVSVSTAKLVCDLQEKADWIQSHIRRTELVEDGNGCSWFNSYYDNSGRQAEGMFQDQIRMMLTGQVFAIMSQTATCEQVADICRAADRHLYDKTTGGYRLNTDFGEVKLDMGRMFGFAYGHKENGAVFSHMAVMYAYSLYDRGFVKEGYKVLKTLFEHSVNFEISRMYPGIPEYFNDRGRGMYSWLTGAASWLVYTVLTKMYGVLGQEGDLVLAPALLAEQFNEKGEASVSCSFAGRQLSVTYVNRNWKEIGDYEAEEVYIDGRRYEIIPASAKILRKDLEKLEEGVLHTIKIILE